MKFFDMQYQMWFLLIPLAAMLFAGAYLLRRRRLAGSGDYEVIAKFQKTQHLLYWSRRGMLLLALFCMVLALMRPRWGMQTLEHTNLGVDIAVLIDISNSMNASDIAPTRLERVLVEVGELSRLLEGHRMSLVLFAGAAFIQCPLTDDIAAFGMFLQNVSPRMISMQGTNIEEALRLGERALDSDFKRNRVILLFSDGEAHTGDAPAQAEALSRNKEIRVFTVGVGSEEGGLIPLDSESGGAGFLRDREGNHVRSRLDASVLKSIAMKGGGSYYSLREGSFALNSLAASVNSIERFSIGEQRVEMMQDRYQIFLTAGLFFLLLFFILPDKRVRK